MAVAAGCAGTGDGDAFGAMRMPPPANSPELAELFSDANDAYAAFPLSEIQAIGAVMDILWAAMDPYFGYNTLPIVAGMHMDSIEGGRIFSPIFERCVYPQTAGTMTVREVARSTWSSSGRSRPDGTFHEYAIDGFQFGLREVKGSGDDTAVLNIETRKWESLSGIVKLD
ncbi:hypothetical protein [Specibacter sp. NPDC078709]|uniref:hypothetical protein n=1 Tax=Specibacter sp. NPDC078709 TaxID=3154364 RepID=UPI00343166D5